LQGNAKASQSLYKVSESDSKYNVVGGSGQEVADLIQNSTTSAAAMNTTVKNTYGVTTIGNLTAQINLLNTGSAAGNASSPQVADTSKYVTYDNEAAVKTVVSLSQATGSVDNRTTTTATPATTASKTSSSTSSSSTSSGSGSSSGLSKYASDTKKKIVSVKK
jgi:hypothetical protein